MAFGLHGLGPVALIGDIEPAPDLGVAIVGQDVVADHLVVVPDGFRIAFDPRRRAGLLAEVKALLIADQQVPFDHAAGRT